MKGKPIGVRFDEDLLIELKELGAQSPQQALNFLIEFYTTHRPVRGEKKATPPPDENTIKIKIKKHTGIKPLTDADVDKLQNVIFPAIEKTLTHQEYELQILGDFRNEQPDNSKIEKQIAAIEAEKIPKERDTPLGRRSWLFDQNKKIEDLKKQIK